MNRIFLIVLGSIIFALPAVADEHEPAFDPTIRQKPLPVITELDDSIDGDTWVSMVYQVKNADAKMFVPILRPMVPQNGHLVAHPASNSLVIADSYANINKLITIVKILDEATPPQQKQ